MGRSDDTLLQKPYYKSQCSFIGSLSNHLVWQKPTPMSQDRNVFYRDAYMIRNHDFMLRSLEGTRALQQPYLSEILSTYSNSR